MSTALPARFSPRNTATAVASPSAFVVLCSRPNGSDAAATILRDTIVADAEQARRFAHRLLDTAGKRHGFPLDVQVVDADGVLVYCCEQGGAL